MTRIDCKGALGCVVTLAAAVLMGLAGLPAAHAETAYVTNQQGGSVSVVDLAQGTVTATVAVGQDPRGLALTPDGRWLLTANQGDGTIATIDLAQHAVVRRIPVGRNVEFLRISADGHRAFATYEPSSQGKPPEAAPAGAAPGAPAAQSGHDDKPDPAAVAVIDLDQGKVIARMPASLETEGMDFSADGRWLVVANEGDDTLVAYDLKTLQQVRRVDLSALGHRPRGVRAIPGGGFIATMENSDNFIVLDAGLQAVKAVPTGKGPYGVAFEPGTNGGRLWIAAARSSSLQVFDGHAFTPLGEVAVGKRCWHFAFNADGSRLIAACGRSNALFVVDPASRKVVKTLEGFKLPWGIVTDGPGGGSLAATRN